jgi:hypothetical protein
MLKNTNTEILHNLNAVLVIPEVVTTLVLEMSGKCVVYSSRYYMDTSEYRRLASEAWRVGKRDWIRANLV